MGAMIGKDFVVVSGFTGNWDKVTKKVYALDTTDSKAVWREMDEVPTSQGFSHAAFAVDGLTMYICGQYVGPSPGPDAPTCLKYEHGASKGKQWSFLPDLPDGRGGGGMFYLKETNSLLYSTGAIRHGGNWIDFKSTWELKLSNIRDGWKTLPDLPYAGNHVGHVSAELNGKKRYFIMGGQKTFDEANGNVRDNYEWDNNDRKWIKRADLPDARGHFSSSSTPYGCGFLYAGGALNGHRKTDDITYYGIDSDKFQSIGDLPRDVNTPVCAVAYLNTGDWLYCVTGPVSSEFSWRIRITN
jgi:hypothetical protein